MGESKRLSFARENKKEYGENKKLNRTQEISLSSFARENKKEYGENKNEKKIVRKELFPFFCFLSFG